MKKTLQHTLALVAISVLSLAFCRSAVGANTIDFSDLNPGPSSSSGSYWNGPDPNGTNGTLGGDPATYGQFTSGGAGFQNVYAVDPTYGPFWEGFAYSNVVNTVTGDYTNQYASVTGGGVQGAGSTYAVGYYDAYTPIIPTVILPSPTTVLSAAVANTTYAYSSMLNGDGFGDVAFSSTDSYMLSIQGYDVNGQPTSAPITFNLAPDGDPIASWANINLSGLGDDVKSLEFSVASTQPSTPSYFALGELTAVPEPSTLALLACGGLAALFGWRRRKAMLRCVGSMLLLMLGTATSLFAATETWGPTGAGSYPGNPGTGSSDAVSYDSPTILEWANACVTYSPGYPNPAYPSGTSASSPGSPYAPDVPLFSGTNCLGEPAGTSTGSHVSIVGSDGSIVLSFANPIVANGVGDEFCVFGNGLGAGYCKLGQVYVSQDGTTWFEEPNYSYQPAPQLTAYSEGMILSDIEGYSGKYPAGYGEPFSIDYPGFPSSINYVKIVDVQGNIGSESPVLDSAGNIINDNYPGDDGTNVAGVGVMSEAVPEPGTLVSLAAIGSVGIGLAGYRLRRKKLLRSAFAATVDGNSSPNAAPATLDFPSTPFRAERARRAA